MAVINPTNPTLNFEICQSQDCQSFSISETTGVYSATNPGWGSPNWEIADAVGSSLLITAPDGTQYTAPLFSTLPDNTETAIVNVTAASLGLSGFSDGIYQFTYTVSVENVNIGVLIKSNIKTILFACNIKCCVDKLIAKIAIDNCSCDDVTVKNALLAYALYQSLLKAGTCGNTTAVSNILARLQKLCEVTNCGCGS